MRIGQGLGSLILLSVAACNILGCGAPPESPSPESLVQEAIGLSPKTIGAANLQAMYTGGLDVLIWARFDGTEEVFFRMEQGGFRRAPCGDLWAGIPQPFPRTRARVAFPTGWFPAGGTRGVCLVRTWEYSDETLWISQVLWDGKTFYVFGNTLPFDPNCPKVPFSWETNGH